MRNCRLETDSWCYFLDVLRTEAAGCTHGAAYCSRTNGSLQRASLFMQRMLHSGIDFAGVLVPEAEDVGTAESMASLPGWFRVLYIWLFSM